MTEITLDRPSPPADPGTVDEPMVKPNATYKLHAPLRFKGKPAAPSPADVTNAVEKAVGVLKVIAAQCEEYASRVHDCSLSTSMQVAEYEKNAKAIRTVLAALARSRSDAVEEFVRAVEASYGAATCTCQSCDDCSVFGHMRKVQKEMVKDVRD